MKRVVVLLLLALAPGACRRPAPAPRSGPARVVSLAPSLTEIAFAVGAGGDLVGIDDYAEFPTEVAKLPRVGGLLNPNIERIVSLRPTLVLMVQTFRTAADKLESAGIATVVIPNESLSDLDGAIVRVGDVTGRRDAAVTLRDRLRRELGDVESRAVGRPRAKVGFVLDRRPGTLTDLYVAGERSFLVDLVKKAGGDNAFGDVTQGAARVGPEEILRHAPDVLLDATRDPDLESVWQKLPSLPAVKGGRVYGVADLKLTVPGPRVAEAARRIAALLHPELQR